jgi:hypothetical protein
MAKGEHPDRSAHMRAEVSGDGLVITIDLAELPYRTTARSLAAKLPGSR